MCDATRAEATSTMTSLYLDAVKEGTFLHHYMQWNAPLETPRAYDFWCGVWLLSSAVGRRIVIPRPGAPVYLNTYVVLCADAGITRKSTAVNRAMETYNAIRLDEERKTVTGSITPEAFIQALALQSVEGRNAEASFISSELVRLLGKEAYAGNMPGLLTDLYDCPNLRTVERTGHPIFTLRNVHITFLGASTAAWLTRAINPDVIEGGFTSRCLFIVDEKRKRRVAWPEGTDGAVPDDVKQSLLSVQRAAERWSSRGITLYPAAHDAFVRWYDARTDDSTDPFIASFESREDHHVLRLAALLAANDNVWVIELRHINYAMRIIEHHKQTAATIFGSAQANIRLTAGLDRLRETLLEVGTAGIMRTALLFKVRTYLKATELDYALALMHELEMVQKFELQTKGRPATIWRATNRITQRASIEALRERFKD
jgi:hypothetical protein